MRSKFNPGDYVYVVERDEFGYSVDASGFMYIAEVCDAVIVSPLVNEIEDINELICYFIEETCNDNELPLRVFPIEDCFYTFDEARIVFERDRDTEEE